MAFGSLSDIVGLQQVNELDTTARAPLGFEMQAQDPIFGVGTFIYLKTPAVAASKGAFVVYNADDWTTVLAVADAIGPVAVNMNTTAAGQFGWFQIAGKAVGKVAAGFADNANVYLTATGGVVDDAIVAGDRIKNAKGASAGATTTTHDGTTLTSSAEFEISRPFVDDGLAA